MTIRYTCIGCGSVLKIKDEKAGTKGKCPKCKAEFLIPSESPPTDQTSDTDLALPEDSVDMPVELTPEVGDSDDFDPAEVLGTNPAFRNTAAGSSPGTATRKPSVAELMKDFEATKKKDKKSTPEITRPAAVAPASALQTAGSAADALSRSYQQKRDSASAPSTRPQDIKEAEKRALLVDFLKTRFLPAAALLIAVGYSYYWWMNRVPYDGPPLYSVTGQVLRQGTPVAGFDITFYPIAIGPDGNRMEVPMDESRGSASGRTDEKGYFELVYRSPFHGAPAGDYEVSLSDNFGTPVVQDEALRVSVTADGENEFRIEL
jgi:phage FluMu protein Com